MSDSPGAHLETLPAAPEGPALSPSATFGAYRIVRLLGRGGMGEVYEVHDPRLERSVAIKVLAQTGSDDEDREQRLTREALALAKLSHPNIVSVHEIGRVGGRLYIAMEYVAGGTLRDWLRRARRTPAEILEVFLGAGRGLAAAHGAGLVHRDFKPDNVLLSPDGRARVVDFGLVTQSAPAADGAVTDKTVGMVGTPGYMSPEQHAGAAVDARSDQYSFCLALLEALHGRAPFEGDSFEALRVAKLRGPGEAPRPRGVPAWVAAAIRRGLSPDPGDRFPTMEPLLAALARRPESRRRLVLVLAATSLVTAAAVGAPALLVRHDPACSGASRRLAGVWDDAARARLSGAFAATGRPYARQAAGAVAARLDRHLGAWATQFRDACEASALRHEQSPAILDRRMACLDRRLAETRAFIDLVSRAPTAAVVDRAVDGARGLADVAQCGDVERLAAAAALPADPAARARVVALQDEIAGLRAVILAGNLREARARAEAVVAHARAVAHGPSLAEALVLLGKQQWETLEAEAAERNLREGLLLATQAHDDRLVGAAWGYLQGVVRRTGRFADAALLDLPYELAVERAGGDPAQRATLLLEKARTAGELGRTAEARGLAEQALEARSRIFGADSPEVARTRSILSKLMAGQGQILQALVQLRLGLSAQEQIYGRTHLQVASQLAGIGGLLGELGRPGEARAALERAIALLELVDGEGINLAEALILLGDVEVTEERPTEARLHLGRALALIAERVPEDSPRRVRILLQLGRLEALTGDVARARATLGRALALAEAGFGREHPVVVDVLVAAAEVERDAAGPAAALPSLERAVAILDREGAGEARATALSMLGAARCATGRAAEGAILAERGLGLTAALAGDGLRLADALSAAGACRLALGERAGARAAFAEALATTERLTRAPRRLERARRALAVARH